MTWLLTLALPAVERAALSTVTAYVVGKVLLVRIAREWREHGHVQRVIADRLDSSTPGGLADLVDAVDAVTARTR